MCHQEKEQRSTLRLDAHLHPLLKGPVSERIEFHPIGAPQRFPHPIFPKHFEPIRSTFDLCLAAITMLSGFVLDASLLSIFKSHVQQALTFNRYRPIDLGSGRRIRVR